MSLLSEREYKLLERLVEAIEEISRGGVRVHLNIEYNNAPLEVVICPTPPSYIPLEK